MCFVNAVPIETTFHLFSSFMLGHKFANIFKGSEFVKFKKGEDFGCMSDGLAPSQWSSVILEKVVKK